DRARARGVHGGLRAHHPRRSRRLGAAGPGGLEGRSAGGDPAMSRLLAARGIQKHFRNGDEITPVLMGIDLDLDPGELVALVGASGSGKSTLLSILGLLLTPSAGEIQLAGQRVDHLPERQRARYRNQKLGFV